MRPGLRAHQEATSRRDQSSGFNTTDEVDVYRFMEYQKACKLAGSLFPLVLFKVSVACCLHPHLTQTNFDSRLLAMLLAWIIHIQADTVLSLSAFVEPAIHSSLSIFVVFHTFSWACASLKNGPRTTITLYGHVLTWNFSMAIGLEISGDYPQMAESQHRPCH